MGVLMSTTSPNMSLILPTVGDTNGPDYALQQNQSFTLVDQHDHSSGKGVQITPAGININTNLAMNGFFVSNTAGLTLTAQGSIPTSNTIYESGVDLYYVDGLGNNVRITQSGALAGTPGSIAGLVAPASATYVPASSKFVWQSNTNIAANMDMGAAIMRNLSPDSTFALTLQPPAGLSANYTLTLPALPGALAVMSLDNTGAMSTITYPFVAASLASNSVTTAKLADANVTRPKLEAVGQQISAECNSFSLTVSSITPVALPNLSVTLTTTGRPVIVMIQGAGPVDGPGSTVTINSTTSNLVTEAYILRGTDRITGWTKKAFIQAAITAQGVGSISSQGINTVNGGANSGITAGANSGITAGITAVQYQDTFNLVYLDTPAAGTYTYSAEALASFTGTATVTFTNCKLVAFEL